MSGDYVSNFDDDEITVPGAIPWCVVTDHIDTVPIPIETWKEIQEKERLLEEWKS